MAGTSLEDVYYLCDPKKTFDAEFFRRYYVEKMNVEYDMDSGGIDTKISIPFLTLMEKSKRKVSVI